MIAAVLGEGVSSGPHTSERGTRNEDTRQAAGRARYVREMLQFATAALARAYQAPSDEERHVDHDLVRQLEELLADGLYWPGEVLGELSDAETLRQVEVRA